MKLNIDCVRDILLYCKQEDDACIEYRTAWSFSGHEYLPKEMVYHTDLCNKAGFFNDAAFDSVPSCSVDGLFFNGQKYLDSIRAVTVFEKVKEKLKESAIPVTLEVVKQIAVSVSSSGISHWQGF